jgi:hypothetical protein
MLNTYYWLGERYMENVQIAELRVSLRWFQVSRVEKNSNATSVTISLVWIRSDNYVKSNISMIMP